MSPPCSMHPLHPLVGVCAICLREKLATSMHTQERENKISLEHSYSSLATLMHSQEREDNTSLEYLYPSIVNKTLDTHPYKNKSPCIIATLASANELQATPFETNTSPQDVLSKLTTSFSFIEGKSMLSPPPTMKEKSLSYYFNLHNEEFSPACSKSSTNRLDFSSSSIDATRNAHTKHHHERGQWKPLLEGSENGKPLSWLSTLFSRRKKKQKARSAKIENGSSSSPPVHWEAPRASSWEQLSAWEKPTSSAWEMPSEEPHRASEAGMEELEAAIAIAKQAEENELMKKKDQSRRPKEEGGQQSKKWIRSVLAIKWAMKLKRRLMKKRQGEVEDEEDKASTASSSAFRGSSYSYHSLQNGQIKGGVCHSHRDLGGSYSSPLHSYTTSSKWHLHKKGQRRESGLLRFYLTPSPSIKLATKRHRSHHPFTLRL